MKTQMKANDKVLLVPYQDGPLCPAVIMDVAENDGNSVVKGVYFNGSNMQTFSVSEGVAGVQLIPASPMLDALVDEMRDRIDQEKESYELSLKRTVKLKAVFSRYFG